MADEEQNGEEFEYQAREDTPEAIDHDALAAAAEQSDGATNPYLREEDQGMEMTPKTFGPPQYGSPDPATATSRLVTLEDGHPLDMLPEGHPAAISEDYAADVIPGEEGGEEVDATDSARELAAENNVNLAEVQGTGADGRVTKGDVEDYIAERDQS